MLSVKLHNSILYVRVGAARQEYSVVIDGWQKRILPLMILQIVFWPNSVAIYCYIIISCVATF